LEGEDFQSKPRGRADAILRCRSRLLPRCGQLAALVDGPARRVPPGEQLLACFRPFLEQLASSSLSPKTIRKHVDNLWLLGGELIRELHEDPGRRKAPASRLLNDRISPDGGPLIHNGSEEDQLAFDSTCRKLCRFLTNPQR